MEDFAERPNREREALVHLFGPSGSIFQSALAYCADCYFEYPLNNFPDNLQLAIERILVGGSSREGGTVQDVSELGEEPDPWLLSFCLPRVGGLVTSSITVSSAEYVVLCLVANAFWKPQPSQSMYTSKKPRRSSSLPSRRALYNQLISLYMTYFWPSDDSEPSDLGELFTRAVADYWIGWMVTNPSRDILPRRRGSAATFSPPTVEVADAICRLCVTLCPLSPGDDAIMHAFQANGLGSSPYSTSSVTLPRARALLQPLLRRAFSDCFQCWPANRNSTAFIAMLRAFNVFVAPWSRRACYAVQDKTLPKDRSSSARTSSRSVVRAVLEQIPTFQSLGHAIPPVEEARLFREWEEFLWRRKDLYLTDLPNALTRAAILRIGSIPEGGDVLSTLAGSFKLEAAAELIRRSVRTVYETGVLPNSEDLSSALVSLASQIDDSLYKGASSVESLRARGPNSQDLQPLCILLGLPPLARGAGSTRLHQIMTSGAWKSRADHEDARKALQELRRSVEPPQSLGSSGAVYSNRDVSFVGGVWERPLRSDEIRPLVMLAYRLSIFLENRFHRPFNLRFLGSFVFLLWLVVLILIAAVVIRIIH
uniref:Uncharacterized protein n=1 Tax=Compsopogon caeruleus TaxID=31354 RepID=A0A7S1TDU4_9RHOD